MRVIVCGGRDYSDHERLTRELERVWRKHPTATLVHGGASGADTLAGIWASRRGIAVEIHPARWDLHGRAAGPRRNAELAALPNVLGVVAFPGGRGTADMISRARSRGIPVHQIT